MGGTLGGAGPGGHVEMNPILIVEDDDDILEMISEPRRGYRRNRDRKVARAAATRMSSEFRRVVQTRVADCLRADFAPDPPYLYGILTSRSTMRKHKRLKLALNANTIRELRTDLNLVVAAGDPTITCNLPACSGVVVCQQK